MGRGRRAPTGMGRLLRGPPTCDVETRACRGTQDVLSCSLVKKIAENVRLDIVNSVRLDLLLSSSGLCATPPPMLIQYTLLSSLNHSLDYCPMFESIAAVTLDSSTRSWLAPLRIIMVLVDLCTCKIHYLNPLSCRRLPMWLCAPWHKAGPEANFES